MDEVIRIHLGLIRLCQEKITASGTRTLLISLHVVLCTQKNRKSATPICSRSTSKVGCDSNPRRLAAGVLCASKIVPVCLSVVFLGLLQDAVVSRTSVSSLCFPD